MAPQERRPSRSMNLQVPKPDDLPREGDLLEPLGLNGGAQRDVRF